MRILLTSRPPFNSCTAVAPEMLRTVGLTARTRNRWMSPHHSRPEAPRHRRMRRLTCSNRSCRSWASNTPRRLHACIRRLRNPNDSASPIHCPGLPTADPSAMSAGSLDTWVGTALLGGRVKLGNNEDASRETNRGRVCRAREAPRKSYLFRC